MSEGDLVKAIFDTFYKHPHVFLWRANAGKFKIGKRWIQSNINGTPDLIGFVAPTGRFVGVECKVGKNDQQDSQVAFQQQAEARGALYILAYSVDDAVNGILGSMG